MASKKYDFTDPTWAGEVSREIAHGLGWVPKPSDPEIYVDESGKDTNYCTYTADWRFAEETQFAPMEDLEAALGAVRLLTKKRSAAFSLDCNTDGMWSAAFRNSHRYGGVPRHYREPSQAICEALIKLIRTPDPRRVFDPEG